MNKVIFSIIWLGFLMPGLVFSQDYSSPPPPAQKNQGLGVRPFFGQDPEEAHKQILIQERKDQQWHDEQDKLDKAKKKSGKSTDKTGIEPATSSTEPVGAPPSGYSQYQTPPTSSSGNGNSGSQDETKKQPEDYSRGY